MFLLWHPSLTAINLSYTFPILETSATALCGTTGIYVHMQRKSWQICVMYVCIWKTYIYIWYIYIYLHLVGFHVSEMIQSFRTNWNIWKKTACSKPGALITNSHDSSSKSSIWWWSKVHIRLFTGFYTSQVVQDFLHQHHDPPKYTKMSKWHACETLWKSYSCSWPHQTPRVASRLLLQVNVPAWN